jgi:hypothetical protein
MRHGVERSLIVACAWLATALTTSLVAQDADAPRAPRILDAPATPAPSAARPAAAPPVTPGRPPNAARLAPLPEERRADDDIEEIIVTGQGWRLPDLGSEWRARQREAEREGRFTALPLYDPSRPPVRADSLFASAEQRRHGYIELFRLRFGRRARD